MSDSIKSTAGVRIVPSVKPPIYLYLLWPAQRPQVFMVSRWKYAHRVFFPATGSRENSMAAFDAAIRAGFGFELDVAMTADHQLVVFHDDSPLRMCGVEGKIWAMQSDEIGALRLAGTREHIPLFSELLSMVHGQVPLIVEIKSSPLRPALVRAVCGCAGVSMQDLLQEIVRSDHCPLVPEHRAGMLRVSLPVGGKTPIQEDGLDGFYSEIY